MSKTATTTPTIPNPITHDQRKNLLISAIEGGSNYWYLLKDGACKQIRKYGRGTDDAFSEKMWKAILAGETIEVHDYENEEDDAPLGTINLDKIYAGEAIIVNKYAWHFANIVAENDDAETGDVWFQLATLGDIVYG